MVHYSVSQKGTLCPLFHGIEKIRGHSFTHLLAADSYGHNLTALWVLVCSLSL